MGSDDLSWHELIDEIISIHAPRVGSDPQHAFRVCIVYQFQSTLPVWGATANDRSIKALVTHFNPRSPCGERRQIQRCQALICSFQSTLPVWGATTKHIHTRRDLCYFNPRSPCGERLHIDNILSSFLKFQSTLPVWGATRAVDGVNKQITFQSTLPVWGAT